MTEAAAACRAALEAALAGAPLATTLATLVGAPEGAADVALRDFAAAHGATALPVIEALADDPAARGVRRVARRALYRLAQKGVTPPPRAAARPVVGRRAERPARAWLSWKASASRSGPGRWYSSNEARRTRSVTPAVRPSARSTFTFRQLTPGRVTSGPPDGHVDPAGEDRVGPQNVARRGRHVRKVASRAPRSGLPLAGRMIHPLFSLFPVEEAAWSIASRR